MKKLLFVLIILIGATSVSYAKEKVTVRYNLVYSACKKYELEQAEKTLAHLQEKLQKYEKANIDTENVTLQIHGVEAKVNTLQTVVHDIDVKERKARKAQSAEIRHALTQHLHNPSLKFD